MGSFVDLTSKRFGKLTVLKRVPNTSPIKWLCLCDCGKEKIVIGNNLKTGNTTSCGCVDLQHKLDKAKDIAGKRFGRLVAVNRADYHYQPCGRRHILWECQCDCGNKKIVDISHLTSGETTSCGCYAIEFRKNAYTHDLQGRKFGKLTVLRQNKKRKSGVYWFCKCECGGFVSVAAGSLVAGLTKSCGCLKMSRGEASINRVLRNLGVNFEREYSFENLTTQTGWRMRFDFALFDSNGILLGLIEYQGVQHYEENKTDADFGKQQREITDAAKREYCQENNIRLIEIPYTENTEYATLCAIIELYANPVPSPM